MRRLPRDLTRVATWVVVVGWWMGVAVLGAAGSPASQPSPDGAEALSPQEVQRLFDAFVVVQAQEQLGLSEQQYGPFVARLKAWQDAKRQLQARRDRILRELGPLSRPSSAAADDADLKRRLDELKQLDATAAADLARAHETIDQLLDVRQQARFRLFLDQMERRKLELLLRARQGRALQRRGVGSGR